MFSLTYLGWIIPIIFFLNNFTMFQILLMIYDAPRLYVKINVPRYSFVFPVIFIHEHHVQLTQSHDHVFIQHRRYTIVYHVFPTIVVFVS